MAPSPTPSKTKIHLCCRHRVRSARTWIVPIFLAIAVGDFIFSPKVVQSKEEDPVFQLLEPRSFFSRHISTHKKLLDMASDSRPDPVVEGEAPRESIEAKAAAEDSQTSDNEGGERPVRNKLKETTINPNPEKAVDISTKEPQGGQISRENSRGRKRSFDEDEPMPSEDDDGHRRKRSRDNSYEEEAPSTPAETKSDQPHNAEKVLSPKKKRSRDQLDKEESKAGGVAAMKDAPEDSAPTEKLFGEGEPEKKRHRDSSQERDKAPIKSAFANTSAVSPFGSLGSSKPKEGEEAAAKAPLTSTSAFASSSLAGFAGSEKSPFGTLGSSSTSVFKSSPATEPAKPAATGFASAAGTSGFATLGSGFSAFGGGFGAAASKGGLTTFASPSGPSVLGNSAKDKLFGAAADEEEPENAEETTESGPGEFEEDKTDERFFERPLETGEEEEKTYFSSKAKLFQFSDKEWRERGVGTFKINVRIEAGKENKKAARMIMRADGVLRVMLNTPFFKGMTVGDAAGNEPKSKQIHLASLENGRSIPCLLRMGSEDVAKELYHVVQDLLDQQ
ncbi:hypothetical protein FE257_010044 [Aspergillus nanangensis]|uniref:RanBD1 domain-containing protein n=1 Tax=Aspergillus nanangensis TaxID=2582783 RepID=A0AAD4CW98_ASPNN|nr:hypothetical protein FE257_010044 [Aspergillus nanangensis]